MSMNWQTNTPIKSFSAKFLTTTKQKSPKNNPNSNKPKDGPIDTLSTFCLD